ncbi:MAG TPA: ABC transporter substrate-binding protein [Acidimicrobiales bacterium]|nr:ABC transporter substrate-binding protein [Acidimicrobiales bacterium]
MKKRTSGTIAVLGLVALGAAACGSSGSSGSSGGSGAAGSGSSGTSGNTASAPGVTPNGITVGIITSTVGVAGPNFVHYADGARARFDVANASGGINGRKLTLTAVDDGGSLTQNQTAAQDLVSKNVFGVIAGTPFFFASAKYLNQQGVPVTGGGFDGPEWGQQPNTNMFSFTGNTGPNFLVNSQNTGGVTFIKMQGGTNIAAMGYGISPSSSASAQAVGIVAPKVGLKAGYINTSIPFGSVNVGPIVLAMKAAHVDSAALQMDNNTNFAIITAAKQAGLNLKVAVSATGYGQTLLDDKAALAAAEGSYFISEGPPLSSTPEKNFRAALKKYANFSGVPGFDWYYGWMSADLMVRGLQAAGKNPTRQSFVNGLHGVTGYDGDGLLPQAVDLSLAGFGKPAATSCGWYAQVKNGQFVPVPSDGRPVCGKHI